MHAHYFSVATRTSEKGLTVFLVPRQEGLETRPVKVAYSASAGTAYVTFNNVKVPAENMLGKENDGLRVVCKLIVSSPSCVMPKVKLTKFFLKKVANFNHERWTMCCSTIRSSRLVVEECMKWACQRKVFGAPLIAQPVIRAK